MEDIMKTIRSRRSVRTFDGREIDTDDMNKLSSFIKKIENPYGIPIEVEFHKISD